MIPLNHIIEGFVNLALSEMKSGNPEIEKEAKRRMTICSTCAKRKGMWCGECGCYLPSKTRSKQICKDWNA